MRFSDFFISYKIKRKDIKNLIPFIKLPLYRKIAIVIDLSIVILGLIIMVLGNTILAIMIYFFALFLLILYFIIDSTKKNLSTMLQKHYAPYSRKRMNLIMCLLNEYNIDISNPKLIDCLIAEAQSNQKNVDYIATIKGPLKILSVVISPLIAFVTQQIGNVAATEEVIFMAIQLVIIMLLVFSLIMTLWPLFKEILHYDYNLYEDLISDLTQVKLFYSNRKTINL